MNQSTGKTYWRSLDELQQTPQFVQFLHREFPMAASEFPEGMSRRRWMQLMGASLALGGLSGCRWEPEKIAPFAVRPENRIPGESEQFATSIEIAGMPRHLLVTCYDGRPVKIEGHPHHTASRGATDAISQATILGLYDPDRSDSVRQISGRQVFRRSWNDFLEFARSHFAHLQQQQGRGLRILLEPTSSVSVHTLLEKLRQRFPAARIHTYSPLEHPQQDEGLRLAFGESLRMHWDLSQARVIACFDADPLGLDPVSIRHARDYAGGRDPARAMNRLYAAESQFSLTGAAADHRLPLRSAQIGTLLVQLDFRVRQSLGDPLPTRIRTTLGPGLGPGAEKFVAALADDLVAHRGRGLVAVGSGQPAAVQALAHGLNVRLGNLDQTVWFTADPRRRTPAGSLAELVSDMRSGEVETLVVCGGNPVYDAPGDLAFVDALAEVNTTIRMGCYEDETSRHCQWHLPQADPYESWGDLRSWQGDLAVTQPLIEPLLGGKSVLELLAVMCQDAREPEQIVRESVGAELQKLPTSLEWSQLVRDGFAAETALPRRQVVPASPADFEKLAAEIVSRPQVSTELVFTPGEGVLDGRFANNGWLQETPDFLTKLTWDNAALISPATAERLNLCHGGGLCLRVDGREVTLPVFVLPGQAEGSIGVALGYGRTAAGLIGGKQEAGVASVGVDVNRLRRWDQMSFTGEFDLAPTSATFVFATTQDHHAIDTVGLRETGRRVGELVREGTITQFEKDPHFAHHQDHHPPLESPWQEPTYEGHAWGMSIDLNKCIGCNACMVACQSENNVPIVGKDQVAKGREMHWIRVDRYFQGDVENPSIAMQPVACHHCENAPCEQVCPVAATVHSDEGLNDMVYNRCIGTRYCANNCPYKVRRFNFLDYNAPLQEPERELVQLAINPEVTVRSRGVMEKCTYCVQRIQTTKIDARNDRRPIRDGEMKTACQQACPTAAIEFGDLNDPDSRVAQAHADARSYGMLAELNVKPRTRYLARVRNPHPSLEEPRTRSATDQGHDHGIR
jgi:molybdopterin-containing oxidoreductase family iron-sulfur binding subunit